MSEIFHIAPATLRWSGVTGGAAFAIGILVFVFGTIGVVMYKSMEGARRATFELSSAGLKLKGDFYGRTIPMNQLVPAEARVVDISSGPYRPIMRTGGTAMPGYRAGWFNLRNGHKALLYVTDPNRVVLVPTTAGYDVLLSVAETPEFVNRLHAMNGQVH
jgi:hypothetical protein